MIACVYFSGDFALQCWLAMVTVSSQKAKALPQSRSLSQRLCRLQTALSAILQEGRNRQRDGAPQLAAVATADRFHFGSPGPVLSPENNSGPRPWLWSRSKLYNHEMLRLQPMLLLVKEQVQFLSAYGDASTAERVLPAQEARWHDRGNPLLSYPCNTVYPTVRLSNEMSKYSDGSSAWNAFCQSWVQLSVTRNASLLKRKLAKTAAFLKTYSMIVCRSAWTCLWIWLTNYSPQMARCLLPMSFGGAIGICKHACEPPACWEDMCHQPCIIDFWIRRCCCPSVHKSIMLVPQNSHFCTLKWSAYTLRNIRTWTNDHVYKDVLNAYRKTAHCFQYFALSHTWPWHRDGRAVQDETSYGLCLHAA